MKLKHILILVVFSVLFMDFMDDCKEPYCLELDCKVITEDVVSDPFKAVLFKNDEPLDSMSNTLNFNFSLKRSEIYHINITKNGYLPRRILIDTHIPDSVYHDELYKLKFDLDLIDLQLIEGISTQYFGEPIVIKFNNQTRWFSKPSDPNL